MERSHTSKLIEETFEEIQKFNYRRFIDEIQNMSRYPQSRSFRHKKHIINSFLERIGLHLMYKSTLEELKCSSYSKMGKWSAVGTIQLALKSPERFDEVYNILSDEESKSIFDWFIKYRTAYAFLGELAGEIYPAKIIKAEFLREIRVLERNIRNGLITLQNFSFESGVLETLQAWNLEQYNLSERCELTEGDYVIDGGAFRGETALWFISKGAAKVYAFEPDPSNFSILIENIKRNKASDKIIPIQKILSNRTGVFSLYAISSGGSVALEGGNESIEGITLDSFVESEGLDKLDFVKLDVEGAELEVLKGAVKTIERFKPKMAISVYHKPDDIITIPKFISEILSDVRFYLSHKCYELSETILFVNPRGGGERL